MSVEQIQPHVPSVDRAVWVWLVKQGAWIGRFLVWGQSGSQAVTSRGQCMTPWLMVLGGGQLIPNVGTAGFGANTAMPGAIWKL